MRSSNPLRHYIGKKGKLRGKQKVEYKGTLYNLIIYKKNGFFFYPNFLRLSAADKLSWRPGIILRRCCYAHESYYKIYWVLKI